jgi:hypothetical protein
MRDIVFLETSVPFSTLTRLFTRKTSLKSLLNFNCVYMEEFKEKGDLDWSIFFPVSGVYMSCIIIGKRNGCNNSTNLLFMCIIDTSPSWEANRSSASQEIPPPPFYGTRRFITAFTKASHLPMFRAISIQSCPHPTSLRSILILSSLLCLGL